MKNTTCRASETHLKPSHNIKKQKRKERVAHHERDKAKKEMWKTTSQQAVPIEHPVKLGKNPLPRPALKRSDTP